MASKPFNVRWIRTYSKTYWKIIYCSQLPTINKMKISGLISLVIIFYLLYQFHFKVDILFHLCHSADIENFVGVGSYVRFQPWKPSPFNSTCNRFSIIQNVVLSSTFKSIVCEGIWVLTNFSYWLNLKQHCSKQIQNKPFIYLLSTKTKKVSMKTQKSKNNS